MKNLSTGRYLLLLTASALLLNFGCSKDETEKDDVTAKVNMMEQRPEEINVEILVKDERKASVAKSTEEAPAIATAAPAQANTCTQNSAPANSQWANGAGLPGSQWPSGAGQNLGSQWPSAGQNPGSQWPANASHAPGWGGFADECVGGAYPGHPVGPVGGPGYGPFPGGFPGAPLFSPYAPYFVADIIQSDDDFIINDDDNFSNDDDSNNDDANINDDDSVNDDDI